MPQLASDPPELPALITRAQALEAGLTRGEVDHRLESGRWIPVRRGVMLTQVDAIEALDPFDRARLLHVAGAVGASLMRPDSVVSHTSAALLHGLPLVSAPEQVSLVVPTGHWSGTRGGVRVRSLDLPDRDTLVIDDHVLEHLPGGHLVVGTGTRVTDPGRTWVDVAASAGLGDAVSAGDALLRRDPAWAARIGEQLAHPRPASAMRRIRAALGLLDGRRETAIESLSSVRFHEWGLPAPQLQVEIRDARGLIGRVDFLWPEAGLIGEADGRLKYRDSADVYREKLREDRLRAVGFLVIRWVWRDLVDPRSALRRRLTDALRTAA